MQNFKATDEPQRASDESRRLDDLPPVPAPVPANLPAVLPPQPEPAPSGARRRFRLIGILLLAAVGAAGGGFWWWQHFRAAQLPPGIVWSNGRIEADEIDVATKFAGRIAVLFADEGDMVKAGQVVARMDTRDLDASLGKADAQARQAEKALDAARADLAQQSSQMRLSDQELERAKFLHGKGHIAKEILDQRQMQFESATAARDAAQARLAQSEHGLQAARQDVAVIQVNIADNTLVAPRDGRIQYRLANVGEVLPAGGKVFTTLDIASVYMDIFLPTAEAGRAVLGADSRIVLDALPDRPIPAAVSFVSGQAQFTPKAVETKSERDKLMFRVRVRVAPDLLRAHATDVRAGLPGVAYVRTDPAVEWPARLKGTGPEGAKGPG